jgi:hypothetical protein
MVPKPIWGAISSYFYPEDVEETVSSPVPSEKDRIDEDGWMLVGPKRAPSPDTDEVGSVIMVNHGSESEDDEPSSKRVCEGQLVPAEEKTNVVKHVKQLNLIEQMLFQHTAASVAETATTPKNSWKARNATYNKTNKMRHVRTSSRNPGRRSC